MAGKAYPIGLVVPCAIRHEVFPSRAERMDPQLQLVVAFAGLGTLFGILGIGMFLKERRFGASAAKATANVVRYEREEYVRNDARLRTRTNALVTVEYTDANGDVRQGTTRVSHGHAATRFQRGQQVAILFDPEQPTAVRIDSRRERYFMAILFAGLGMVSMIVGLTVWFLNVPVE